MREAQPLIIQAEVMREEMTSCCEVEYTGKSIPLLLHQVRCFCRSLSVHKGCYIGNLYNIPWKKESTDECPRFPVTPFLATLSGTKIGIKNPIPYISGISETIACILQSKNQFVAAITNVRDKDKREDRQGAVYKIKKTTVSLDFLFTCQIPSKGS